MAINNIYPGTSPYQNTGVVNKQFLDIMINRPIPKLQDDVYWEITRVYEYRPDLLAYDLYKDSRLWWVFAQRNPNTLVDPLFSFTAGTLIYIPKLDTLKLYLGI
jgi:hypothetical protein